MDKKRILHVTACRVCRTPENNKVIMETTNGWLDLFSYCFGLEIDPKDPVKALCEQCADSIKCFAKVKAKCLESDKIWKSVQYTLQHKLQPTNDNEKTTNIEYVVDTKDNKVNETHELNRNIDSHSDIDSDETDCSVGTFEEPDNNIEQNQLEGNTKNSFSKKFDNDALSSNTEEQNQYEIKSETDIMECLNELESLEENFILESKKEINTFLSTVIDRKEAINSTEFENDTITKNNVDEKSENVTLQLVEANTKNASGGSEKTLCKCGLSFPDDKKYTCHVKKCDVWRFHDLLENKSYAVKKCGLCDYHTQNVNLLIQHFDEHYTRNDLECKLCDYTGQDFANMAFHRYTHMPTEKSKLHCLKCLKRFLTPKTLQFHFRSVHLGKKIAGLCFCGTTFTSIKKWINHERIQHGDLNGKNKIFVCDCCGLRFGYRYDIIVHLRRRIGLNKLVCDKCGAAFNTNWNLKSHIMNKHIHTERIKCPKCPKTFTYSSLQQHIELMHGDKKFVCELCSAAYTSIRGLKYHMLSHTKLRPFKCVQCDATYKNLSGLSNHIMTKHTKEHPFMCTECNKGFNTLNQLKTHNNKVHTKLRRYQCKFCDRSFNARKLFVQHCVDAHPKPVLLLPAQ